MEVEKRSMQNDRDDRNANRRQGANKEKEPRETDKEEVKDNIAKTEVGKGDRGR